ncbi:hypothetical protein ACC817_08825 [Rhizobium ruizarguesonis]|uniref:hypothetical protein n=1 Tax=Rhizobium ruizarguesonis TaxID=2081791 RepID=UPI001031E952|nr:hypothetical protein [Rhizobium ruizarguesonis]TAY74173.1 hypothetical protein ELH84_09980 [Rhizobium ruizarguesonis]WSH67187.1 hypothetical protein U8Q05_12600 [Rhizobium ruizarguesonis]
MTAVRKLKLLLLAAAIGVSGLELGNGLSIPGLDSVFTPAEARVGRPLTPVSVAGVARRSVRRCAVGVYDC